MNKIIDIAPLIIFVALILVLLTFLSEKEDQLESVLIDSTFPEFSIASLKDPKENKGVRVPTWHETSSPCQEEPPSEPRAIQFNFFPIGNRQFNRFQLEIFSSKKKFCMRT